MGNAGAVPVGEIASSGKFPCAPLTTLPFGIARVWHVAQEFPLTSIVPFFRITYRSNGMTPFGVTGTPTVWYQSGERTWSRVASRL
jgi:hypothetical protein